MSTPEQLIAAVLQMEDWMSQEQKRFEEFMKPHRAKIDQFKIQLQEQLLSLNSAKPGEHPRASIATDAGTAYLSTVVTPSINGDKVEFLDWVMEDWNRRGAMLNIGAPLKAGLQEYQDSNDGQLPPMVKTNSLTRVNVKRS